MTKFNSVEAYRRTVLLALLVFTACLGISFAYLNYQNQNFSAMFAEIGMAAFAVCLMPFIRTTRHLVAWSFVYLLLFNSAMMFIISTPLASPSVFAWVLLIPILSHMLLGRALGGGMTLVFMIIAFSMYYSRYGDDTVLGNSRALLNIAGVAVCIFGFSFVYETSRSRAETALRRMAFTDPLTGLGNRAHLYHRFREEELRYERAGTGCSILLFDIDFFKSINDSYGHEVGDDALILIAAILTENTRTSDDVFRYGGEEFCILFPETAPEAARHMADNLRKLVQAAKLESNGDTVSFTTSIGVASMPGDGTKLREVMQAADARLYAAKERGRNRVVAS